MKFFYWADKDSPSLGPIKQSAAVHNIDLQPIGVGKGVEKDWDNSLFKQDGLYDAVLGLAGNEIVCATDGFDVFYQQGPDSIEKSFLKFNRDVVFSAEKGFFHQYGKYKPFFDGHAGDSPYKYLNAGSVIGYAGALRKLYRPEKSLRMKVGLTRLLEVKKIHRKFKQLLRRFRRSPGKGKDGSVSAYPWFYYSDQALMARYVATGKHGLSLDLDRQCLLFGCTAFEWDDILRHYTLVDGTWRNLHTGQTPACIHVPHIAKYPDVHSMLFEGVYGTNLQAPRR